VLKHPKHPWCAALDRYPAAFEDCVAILRWIRREHPGALISLGGFSAGATLALTAAHKLRDEVAAVVAFYPAMNFSAESDNSFPEENPYIRNLFHQAYLLGRPADLKDPCLSPSYATSETLPRHVALLAGAIDPNIRDMEKFIGEMERARPQGTAAATAPFFVGKVFAGAFHGWNYLPDWVLGKSSAAASMRPTLSPSPPSQRDLWPKHDLS